MSLETFIQALEPLGVKRSGTSWKSRCPAHDDKNPSLSISRGDDGRALVKCQAGCDTADVIAGVGFTFADLFDEKQPLPPPAQARPRIVREYDYRDEKGTLLYQALRYEPKDFRQRRPDGKGGWIWTLEDTRRVLYRLPDLLKAPKDVVVFVVEGEKDVDALTALGLVATTNVGGAGKGKWKPEYSELLRGRQVVILPDNDDPGQQHAAAVEASIREVAKSDKASIKTSVKTVRLPGLPPKGDVSDWLAAGGDVQSLKALVATKPASMVQSFQQAPDRIIGERSERVELGKGVLSFGVRFLDDAMGGITKRDLVIMGAKTGTGKTALATIMALRNCVAGKRVHYFALEAEDREIERRMKFQIIATEYYKTRFHPTPIRYLDWYNGWLEKEIGHLEDFADAEINRVAKNLQTFYRIDSFTSDDFARRLDEIKESTDLVILDHLHYVDSDDENENRAYKRIVKKIRDSALQSGRPVVVVAHVRKGDRRNDTLIPTVEDFHGSSDVPKMATKAVMIAPAYDLPNAKPYLWNTYIQPAKCRTDSSVTRYVALTPFNTQTNSYDDDYDIGKLTDGGKVFTALSEADSPAWSRKRRAEAGGYGHAD